MSKWSKRNTELHEIMDDFAMNGTELTKNLDEIENINKWLGGHGNVRQGVKQFIKRETSSPITIADVGCGNGGTLRMLALWARKKRISLRLVGIDANRYTIAHAQSLSKGFPEIQYVCQDIFSESFIHTEYDVLICTLTLHHFDNEKIKEVLKRFEQVSQKGIIINDLQRCRLAYYLFAAISIILGLSHMSRHDGLISILRGFKKKELHKLGQQLNLKKHTIRWQWAFRYQWIIHT